MTRAMVLERPGEGLRLQNISLPPVGPTELRIDVAACGVCRTDLHVVDGELPAPKLPLVPGHEIVGTVAESGVAVEEMTPGTRVGVPWLALTCGSCAACLRGAENLCDGASSPATHATAAMPKPA